MSIDVDVLIDMYTTLKEYIPAKERQAAADHVVSGLVDSVSERDLKEFSLVDNYTKRAAEEYIIEDEDDDDNYEYDD